ncbi:hypothetical protein P43SY_000427 [Pythium insidiosum]|uniref:Uncharacterized protein n=1 Tax=Pythium insidiosum TaxID=114742 RepID=A0AAD5LG10_PYTIN|nr:hypothetical protein P43SY_000427 [Pythium insidiosum]
MLDLMSVGAAHFTATHHPNAWILYASRVNVSATGDLPAGLTTAPFPPRLADIQISQCNLRSLPADLTKWPKWMYFVCDDCQFAVFPPALARMQPFGVALAGAPLQSFPFEAFQIKNLEHFSMRAVGFPSLAPSPYTEHYFQGTTMRYVYAQSTNVTWLPRWVDAFAKLPRALWYQPALDLAGTPLCDALSRLRRGEIDRLPTEWTAGVPRDQVSEWMAVTRDTLSGMDKVVGCSGAQSFSYPLADDDKRQSDQCTDLEDALAAALFDPAYASSRSPAREEDDTSRLAVVLYERLFPSEPRTRQRPTKASTKPRASTRPRKHLAPPAAPAQAVALSPSNVSRMLQRFSLSEDKRLRRLAALRQRALHEEGEAAPFAPTVSPRSQAITAELPDFLSRQRLHLEHRERRLEGQRQRRQRLESEAIQAQTCAQRQGVCVCVCGGSDRTTAGDVSQEAHSPTCRRFLALCAGSKKKRAQVLPKRSLRDILAFDREKQRKQQALAAIQRAREAQESTFSPRINPTSTRVSAGAAVLENMANGQPRRQIYEAMLRRRREQQQQGEAEPVDHEPVDDDDEWEDAEQPETRASETAAPARSSLVPEPRRRPRSGSRGAALGLAPAAFSESLWTQQPSPPRVRLDINLDDLSRAQRATTIALDRQALVRWTTIAFDVDSAGFILDNFEIPRPLIQ